MTNYNWGALIPERCRSHGIRMWCLSSMRDEWRLLCVCGRLIDMPTEKVLWHYAGGNGREAIEKFQAWLNVDHQVHGMTMGIDGLSVFRVEHVPFDWTSLDEPLVTA